MGYPRRERCLRGHKLDAENTRIIHNHVFPNGQSGDIRSCRKCETLNKARQRARARMAIPCDDCGETGRVKAIAQRGSVVKYFCHDEEKSCYIYRKGTYFYERSENDGGVETGSRL
jgi:hypothetical protein